MKVYKMAKRTRVGKLKKKTALGLVRLYTFVTTCDVCSIGLSFLLFVSQDEVVCIWVDKVSDPARRTGI